MAKCEVKRGADGVFYARPYLGKTPEGKTVQPYKKFPDAATEEEAQELADAWAANLTVYGLVRSALIADLLSDYTDMRARNGASPNSIKSYRTFTGYVRQYMPSKAAADLTVMDFNRFEQRLLMPKEKGGQGLCRNSVLNVHHFLRGAYKFFMRAGIVSANPLINVAAPSYERHEAMALETGDFAALERLLRSLLSPPVVNFEHYRRALPAFGAWLALRTGMRCGEVCAVRPCDVMRMSKAIHVGGTVIEERGATPYRRDVTKGRKCRNVAVTDGDIETIDAFLELRRRCLGFERELSVPLITEGSSWYRPTLLSRGFRRIAASAGLPTNFKFHDLRHTHATWLLLNGVDLKTVSERLGHADEATTLRLYAHVLPGRDAWAASVFEQAAAEAAADVREVLQ